MGVTRTHMLVVAALSLSAFAASAGAEPVEWLRSGTRYFFDFRPGAGSSLGAACTPWREKLGDLLILAMNDGVCGCEPHVFGDLDTRPLRLADIAPGELSSQPADFTVCGDRLFFTAGPMGVHLRDLWVTDGTPEGTFRVKEINSEGNANVAVPTCIEGLIYFHADDGVHGSEPWVSDGTPEGTYMLADVNPDGNSVPGGFLKFGEDILFSATDSVYGREYRRLIPEPPGSEVVVDLLPGSDSGALGDLTDFTGGLIGSGAVAPATRELYYTDGTAAGTRLVKVINDVWQSPFVKGSNPRDFTVLGDVVVFSASGNAYGREPWVSDGTEAGTFLLKDIDPRPYNFFEGASMSEPFNRHGDFAFFKARDGENNEHLWRTDGTPEGTVRYLNSASQTFANPLSRFQHRGFLYFRSDGRLVRIDRDYQAEIVQEEGTLTLENYHRGLFTTFFGNATVGTELGAQNAAPWVESFVPEEGGPTDAQEVGFLLRFSEPVTGVDPTDFAVEAPGLWGAAVVAADPLDDGQLWRVVVDTGLGDGSVSLRLVDDDSIVDVWALRWAQEADPPPLAPLEGYGTLDGSFDSAGGILIDKPAPTVLLSSPAPARTGLVPIPVTVAFERPVTGFTAESLLVENAEVQDFSGSGADYAFSLMPLGFGVVWAQVPADAAVDGGDLGNAPSNRLTFDYDLGALLHAADQNGDGLINLSELLRVVQFYNTAGYHCEAPDAEDPEDAYKAGPGADTACLPHSSDYKPQDWAISLSELLRLVQFYNTGGYHYCADAQEEGDGYCAGPDPQG